MFLKDHLKDTYKKASFDKNHLMVENIINRWAHRFGIKSLNELFVKNQDQIKLIEEDQVKENQNQIKLIEENQVKENQNQINLESLENVQYKEEREFKSKETKRYDTEIIDKDIYRSRKYKSEYEDKQELPLPNINNLRKWINKDKKAS